jgi:hypothetical protein
VGSTQTLAEAKDLAYSLQTSDYRKRWTESGTREYDTWTNRDLEHYIRATVLNRPAVQADSSAPVFKRTTHPYRVIDTTTGTTVGSFQTKNDAWDAQDALNDTEDYERFQVR